MKKKKIPKELSTTCRHSHAHMYTHVGVHWLVEYGKYLILYTGINCIGRIECLFLLSYYEASYGHKILQGFVVSFRVGLIILVGPTSGLPSFQGWPHYTGWPHFRVGLIILVGLISGLASLYWLAPFQGCPHFRVGLIILVGLISGLASLYWLASFQGWLHFRVGLISGRIATKFHKMNVPF